MHRALERIGGYDILNEPDWTFEGKDKNGRDAVHPDRHAAGRLQEDRGLLEWRG
jgi:hypothetical protein